MFRCPQSDRFKSSPQTAHSPLQSGLQIGLIGISSRAYSRISGCKSIWASSGRIRSDSLTDFLLNAYSSVKFQLRLRSKSLRQRTHSRVVSAEKSACTISPCGVRPIVARPSKLRKSRSSETWICSNSKGISCL